MATDVDSLRSTLDSLSLSPAAKADRPYLESVLRRLGYSDADIAAYFSGPQTPQAAPAETEDRLIEIEYTGPGLRSFAFVEPVDPSELQTGGLGAGLEAGDEVISAGPSMEEVDRLMENQDLSDFGDTGFQGEAQEEVKFADAPGEEVPPPDGQAQSGEGGEAGPGGGEGGEGAKEGEEVAFKEDPYKLGEGMVEFQAIELSEGVTAPLPDPTEEGWQPLSLEEAQREVQDEEARSREALEAMSPPEPIPGLQPDDTIQESAPEGDEAWEVVAEAPERGGYTYKDWTLYSKEHASDDGRQRIYFFSKGEPSDGEPSDLPPGYEVSENERTGLPYLRRVGDEDADPDEIPRVGADVQRGKKKRVRVKRVRAGSKEEAEGKISKEGGNPLATMPIDIEERWDQ